MATILLSIKPEYANKIFDGQKHYEYRKRIPKKEVSKIVVYSSAPEQAVIGEVEVVKTLKMKPTPLWNSTKANAGINLSIAKGCEYCLTQSFGVGKKGQEGL